MFYYSIVDVDSLRNRMPSGSSPQMRELHRRTFSIMNNEILAAVFNRLPKEHVEPFANLYATNCNDPALLDYLRNHIGPGIDDEIREAFAIVCQKVGPLLDSVDDQSLWA